MHTGPPAYYGPPEPQQAPPRFPALFSHMSGGLQTSSFLQQPPAQQQQQQPGEYSQYAQYAAQQQQQQFAPQVYRMPAGRAPYAAPMPAHYAAPPQPQNPYAPRQPPLESSAFAPAWVGRDGRERGWDASSVASRPPPWLTQQQQQQQAPRAAAFAPPQPESRPPQEAPATGGMPDFGAASRALGSSFDRMQYELYALDAEVKMMELQKEQRQASNV